MPKPTRSTLNGKQIARQLVADTMIPAFQSRVERIMRLVEGPLNTAVDDFFADLSSYMGSPQDLAAQLGPDAGALGSWVPLSPDYVRRKGNDQFWIFTAGLSTTAANALAVRMLMRGRSIRQGKVPSASTVRRRRKQMRDVEALIPTFRALKGSSVFGPVKVRIATESLGLMQFKPGDPPITASKVNLRIRLWTGFTRAELAHPDEALFGKGVIDLKTLFKLTNNRPKYRRPLVKPFLSYYGLFKLPRLLRSIIEQL